MPVRVYASHIYVIGVTTNPVKIGYAADPKGRMAGFQVGCPDELVLHHAIKVSNFLAPIVESRIHNYFQPHRRRGEWFDVEAEEAAIAIKATIQAAVDDATRMDEGPEGLLKRIENRYALRGGARQAIDYFKTLHDSALYVKRRWEIEDHLKRTCGKDSLAALQRIFLTPSMAHQGKLTGKGLEHILTVADLAMLGIINELTGLVAEEMTARPRRAA